MAKKALLVGINAYPGYPLQGCINDINDYKITLQSKGFTVTTLTNASATRTKILSYLNTLVTGRRSGDSVVFAYSGHGSQQTDTSGDEPDQKDECIVSVDMRAVLDDEIRAYLGRLPAGVTTDVFLDCCHSGTGTRMALLSSAKWIPSAALKRTARRDVIIVPEMKHDAWLACKDTELAAEVQIDGVYRGAFSYFVLKAIRAGGTRSQNIAYACQQIAALGLQQTPQLELPQTEAEQPAFT